MGTVMFEVCDGGGSGKSTRATVDSEDLTTRGRLDWIAMGVTGFCGIGWRSTAAIVIGAGATGKV